MIRQVHPMNFIDAKRWIIRCIANFKIGWNTDLVEFREPTGHIAGQVRRSERQSSKEKIGNLYNLRLSRTTLRTLKFRV